MTKIAIFVSKLFSLIFTMQKWNERESNFLSKFSCILRDFLTINFELEKKNNISKKASFFFEILFVHETLKL